MSLEMGSPLPGSREPNRRSHPLLESLRQGARDNLVFTLQQFEETVNYVARDYVNYCGQDSIIRKEVLELAEGLGKKSSAATSRFIIFPQDAKASLASALQRTIHRPMDIDRETDPQTVRRVAHARVGYLLNVAQELNLDPLDSADEELINQVETVLRFGENFNILGNTLIE